MKIWLDAIKPAPEGYVWCQSVNDTKTVIVNFERDLFDAYYIENTPFEELEKIEVIDIDYKAGNYKKDGGNYIKLLKWFEETGRNYPIHIHSMNSRAVTKMRAIIKKNDWKEVR